MEVLFILLFFCQNVSSFKVYDCADYPTESRVRKYDTLQIQKCNLGMYFLIFDYVYSRIKFFVKTMYGFKI